MSHQTRRLLLVAYHFPPATAVGALRWERLAIALAEDGWEVDVLMRDPAQLDRRDEARAAALSPAIRSTGVAHEAPVLEQMWNGLARATRKLRSTSPQGHRSASAIGSVSASVAVPTLTRPARPSSAAQRSTPSGWRASINARLHIANELAWVDRVVRAGRFAARTRAYHAVITSGPPHFVHVAGLHLSKALGIPHVPDFRDPWSLAESIPRDLDSPVFHAQTRDHEAAVVSNAAAVVMNTEAAAEAMQQRYPEFASRITYIMNGSDADDYRPSPPRSRFIVSYAGTLYLQRDPRVMLRACAPLVHDEGLTPDQFAIEFLGSTHYDGQSVAALAESQGLGAHVIVRGQVPREEALVSAATSSLLVALPDGQQLTIQAKLFEYVQLDAWLMAFATPESAIARALAATSAAVIAPGDEVGAQAVVRDRWLRFAAGEVPTRSDASGALGRPAQARRLLELLDRVAT